MIPQHELWLPCLMAVSLFSSGCLAGEEGEEEVRDSREAALTSNALTSNALTSNALTSNALTSNALTSNALTSNALTSNTSVLTALNTDPNARQVFHYIVGCALRWDQFVD